ncbi:hypothetical protein DDZ14_08365 [Maritimibacter sp. 55A14]|uniref:ASCH domain-containing protein n=1 Tax=Maritimibacter sp. 55A14 TaxID=2174844 RepID=UPI000D61FD57|nr:ASCH domain-containing protein [Maritimibacter sp. 55A14]PWE32750.1 hypothetical protein DDZ14_08365 [Maritimibacter sp. 55A14]
MKAISIRQPWADAILHHGKDVENRNWYTPYRGPVLIHAAKAWGPAERADLELIAQIIGRDLPATKPRLGGIVGRAEIVDCVTEMASPWFFGRFGFVLRNAEPLPFQPCRGALGFFEPNDFPPPADTPWPPPLFAKMSPENPHDR